MEYELIAGSEAESLNARETWLRTASGAPQGQPNPPAQSASSASALPASNPPAHPASSAPAQPGSSAPVQPAPSAPDQPGPKPSGQPQAHPDPHEDDWEMLDATHHSEAEPENPPAHPPQ